MTKFVGFLVCIAVSENIAIAQRDYSQIQIKPTKLTDHVYMLEGSGGNIGVTIGEDGVLIIDDQFAPLADKIKEAIAALGGTDPAFTSFTPVTCSSTNGSRMSIWAAGDPFRVTPKRFAR